MSNLIFVTWDGGGNVPPALGVAAELQHRGHRVRVMGHPVQHAQVKGAGLDFAAERVPYVVLEHMYDAYLVRRWLRGPTGLGLAVKRIPPRKLLKAAAARMVVCVAELDPAGSGPRPRNLRYTGPAVTGVPAGPTEPTVLVSLSTVNFPGQARLRRCRTSSTRSARSTSGASQRLVLRSGPRTWPPRRTSSSGGSSRMPSCYRRRRW